MARDVMKLVITPKQQDFINAKADEVLFGGAAGGGKSHGQLVDALLFAAKYEGSKQLVLRRTYPELESSLIMVSLEMYPREIAKYNDSKHLWTFKNGSSVRFGYCGYEKDVYRYQSAEFDVVRIDELTHFTEFMYTYLLSRIRGANGYPKQMKCSTNPGGVGHVWVKERFIDPVPPCAVNEAETGNRVFIPAGLDDNRFLRDGDPGYEKRLENLDEKNYKALRLGDWNLLDGQFFPEFSLEFHTCAPFDIPAHWRRYRVLDYGLDMLACYWIAVDEQRRAWVYREVYEPGLIISEAAKRILEESAGERVTTTLAPPDLWNRERASGKSQADIFAENGILLTRSGNDRVDGWMATKEWLKVKQGEDGTWRPDLVIFDTCRDLIRTLPSLQYDERRRNDAARDPHELTHAPDALRYFCIYWTLPAEPEPQPRDWDAPASYEDQLESFLDFGM